MGGSTLRCAWQLAVRKAFVGVGEARVSYLLSRAVFSLNTDIHEQTACSSGYEIYHAPSYYQQIVKTSEPVLLEWLELNWKCQLRTCNLLNL
jgi:hypothetical protein